MGGRTMPYSTAGARRLITTINKLVFSAKRPSFLTAFRRAPDDDGAREHKSPRRFPGRPN